MGQLMLPFEAVRDDVENLIHNAVDGLAEALNNIHLRSEQAINEDAKAKKEVDFLRGQLGKRKSLHGFSG